MLYDFVFICKVYNKKNRSGVSIFYVFFFSTSISSQLKISKHQPAAALRPPGTQADATHAHPRTSSSPPRPGCPRS